MIAARAAMSHKPVAIHIKNLKLWMPVPLFPLIFYPPFTVLGQDKYFIFRAPPLFTEVPAPDTNSTRMGLLKDTAGGVPFFLYLATNAPHTPAFAPPRHQGKVSNVPPSKRVSPHAAYGGFSASACRSPWQAM